jgi:hypothetical protein
MITRARFGAGGEDLAGGFDPVDVRHANVQQHDVRVQLSSVLNRFEAVGRFADELEVVVRVEDCPQRRPRERVVVGDQYAPSR